MCARAYVPRSHLRNVFYKLFHTSCPHRSWKLYPKVISGQVTRSGQVTLRPKIFATPQWLQFNNIRINIKLSGADWGTSTCRVHISESWFQWPEVSSTFWPYHYRAMGKCSNAFYSEDTRWSMLIIQRLSHVRLLWMTHTKVWPIDPSFGSFQVICCQMRFCL